MAAVFFTLLLLTGNTMAQAVRERGYDPDDQIKELADIASKFKASRA